MQDQDVHVFWIMTLRSPRFFSTVVMTYFQRFSQILCPFFACSSLSAASWYPLDSVGQDEVILVMLGSQPTASAVEGYAKESLKLPPVTGTRSEDVGMFRCFFVAHIAL